MDKNLLTGLVIGLLGGVIVGYALGSSHAEPPPSPAPMAAGAPFAGAPAGVAPQAPSQGDYPQRIAMAEQIVLKDAKNVQAWIALGNDYFDTHQQQKAIDSYQRALELAPGNPDVLTDQGVMYRELGQFDKAIANFEKANKLSPQHVQSLYNLGVVFAFDKKQIDKAVQAWTKVVEIAPASEQATQARQALAQLKQQGAAAR